MTHEGDWCHVTTYDIAGNQMGKKDAQQYSQEVHCILLCYSLISESSFEEIWDWLSAIDQSQDHHKVPIILVGTKLDLAHSERVVET